VVKPAELPAPFRGCAKYTFDGQRSRSPGVRVRRVAECLVDRRVKGSTGLDVEEAEESTNVAGADDAERRLPPAAHGRHHDAENVRVHVGDPTQVQHDQVGVALKRTIQFALDVWRVLARGFLYPDDDHEGGRPWAPGGRGPRSRRGDPECSRQEARGRPGAEARSAHGSPAC